MRTPFTRPKGAVYTDHINILGGGTVHCFRLIEFLKDYYDLDVLTSEQLQTEQFMKNMMNLDISKVKVRTYQEGDERLYGEFFLNVSHWRIKHSVARKKFAVVFFPQVTLDPMDYVLMPNSKYTAGYVIQNWGAKKENIRIIYPPIMTDDFKPVLPKGNYIIHCSRIISPSAWADKGHRQMIEAMKKLNIPNWTLHMVGQIQDQNYYAELVSLARDCRVNFHPSLDYQALQNMYGRGRIYWHMTGITMPGIPSAQEHFGMTTVEAMSAGCVPVVLATGGQPEIVQDGKSGYLIHSVDELVDRTRFLISNPDIMEKMSIDAQKRAKEFDKEKIKIDVQRAVTEINKVSVVMLTWNQLEKTKVAIESLYKYHPDLFELIVVDNASTDGTVKWLTQERANHKKMRVFVNRENKGFAKANNFGAEQASGEYIVFLNNDTETRNMWLHRVVEDLKLHKNIGALGARLYFPGVDSALTIQHAGVDFKKENGVWDSFHSHRGQSWTTLEKTGLQKVKAVTGACLGVRKKDAFFSEEYGRSYYEDTDLCMRIQKRGDEVYLDHDIELIHDEGSSQRMVSEEERSVYHKESQEIFRKKWSKFLDKMVPKWQEVPDLERPRPKDKEKNLESDVLERLSLKTKGIPLVVVMEHMLRYLFVTKFLENKDVLDVACGTGYGLEYMSHWAKSVSGYDISPEAIREAEAGTYYCPTFFETRNLETNPILSNPVAERFDIVTCFETVEHLENPKFLIESIKKHLKPEGIIFFSVPNSKLGTDKNPWHKQAFDSMGLQKFIQDVKLTKVSIWGQDQYGFRLGDLDRPYLLVQASL